MTKTQISVRLNPDTLAAIDAEARRLDVSRGNVVDRRLTVAAQTASTAPDMQLWRKVHELLLQANDYVTSVDNGYGSTPQMVAALRCIITAISALNDSPAGGQ